MSSFGRIQEEGKSSVHYTFRHLIKISYQLHSFIKEIYEGKKQETAASTTDDFGIRTLEQGWL